MEDEKMPNQYVDSLQKQNHLLKFLLFIFLSIILFAGGFFFNQFYRNNLTEEPTESPKIPVETVEPIKASPASMEKPEEQESPEVSEFPSASPMSDVELLKEAFGEKYERDPSKANVEITEREGNYVKGVVKFIGDISGGWFLAYYEDDDWTIVADGNGTVPCSPVEQYDFPVEMVPECYRESDGTLVER